LTPPGLKTTIPIDGRGDPTLLCRTAGNTFATTSYRQTQGQVKTKNKLFFRKESEMSKFKKYEHLPWWEINMNHHTLTPLQLEVHNLDYYCKRYGTKLSHRNAAKILHRSERGVSLARRRLEELGLRTSEPAKGSCRIGHPIEYQNEAEFRAQLEARGVSLRGAMIAPKSSSKKKSLPKVNSLLLEGSELAPGKGSDSPQGGHPPCNPPAVQGGKLEHHTTGRKNLEKYLETKVKIHAARIHAAGTPLDQAERIARARVNQEEIKKGGSGGGGSAQSPIG